MTSEDELRAYRELRSVVARLRAPDGCPWDREQTHASLRPYVIQEAYEVLAALDEGDLVRLRDELGDLLWQVLIHVQLAEEAREFAMADVIAGLADKLVRRHPHVFGEARVASAQEAALHWEELKGRERDEDASALAAVPEAMPALAYAQELLRRAAAAGFAWPRREDVLAKVAEQLAEVAAAEDEHQRLEEFGHLLFNLANYARHLGVDAEEALRLAARKFRRRFEATAQRARAGGRPLAEISREELIEFSSPARDVD